jgi:hypothetical protein
VFKFTPAQYALGGLSALGTIGAGLLFSKEKKRAQNRVESFKTQDIKDWDKFTENTARKSFVQELGKDPMTDPKLLQYADSMNRLKTGTIVSAVPGSGRKSYQITKLRGSERLGCTCNDWRYKRSVAQPGEEKDCKHIKQFKQMNKTAAARFQDDLSNPVIDGKPHKGTWTIVGSGRLSIPKKTSDIDYMVPLEEVGDISSFNEYKDVPGAYWKDLDPVNGRPATVVAVPRYAYDKIDASYQQAVDRFGRRKLRHLKKTLPKDSFYKDIGVVYTSDAMKKESAYEEGSSFTHDGQEYSLREAFRTARTKPTEKMAVDKLKWVLQYDQPDPLRVASADLKAPVIVAPDRKGRPTVVDGLHRLTKAVQQGKKTLPAKVLTLGELKKEAGHVEDRIAERAPGATYEVAKIRARIPKMSLRKGQTYHVPLKGGKGYAVIGDIGPKHVVKTVLGPNMQPPGERLKVAETQYRTVTVDNKSFQLDSEIPLIKKVPKTADRLKKFLEDRISSSRSSRWSHPQIAIPASIDLSKIPGAVKTRAAIPLPDESLGAVSTRIGNLHAHTIGAVHIFHRDSHAPSGIVDAVKHAPEALRALKVRFVDRPDSFVKDARAPRDYKKEYRDYHSKTDQIENRSLRNQARRKLGLKKGDPREVDHKKPLSKGGSNGHGNLRAISLKTNRSKFTGDA